MLTSWNQVATETAERFSRGCGVNLMRPSSAIKLLKKRKLIHILTAKGNQKLLYQRIFLALRSRRP